MSNLKSSAITAGVQRTPNRAMLRAVGFGENGTDWILDPTNPTTVDDGMGHTNNVYVCVP